MTDFDTAATVVIPEAPPIEGLLFRRLRGPDDFAAMARIFNQAMVADQFDRAESADSLRTMYGNIAHFDIATDLVFAEIDGELVGYGRTNWWDETDGPRIFNVGGNVAPAWQRRGIGGALLAQNMRRAREIAAANPIDHPQWFQSVSWATAAGRQALLARAGFSAIRHSYEMLRDLAAPIGPTDLPAGIEVRAAQPEHYRPVFEADVEAFRDHWGAREISEADYQGWLASPLFQPDLWQVAWEGDQVVGMVLNFIDHHGNATFGRQRGYTEGISVRRPWRKRGVASALINRSLLMFREMGMREAALGVDAENLSGALRVYENCGFKVVKQSTVYRLPL